MTWGRDTDPETVDRFAAMVDADWFITGHQPCDEGFRQANHRQIIIDGTDPYPTYCLFPAREPMSMDRLRAGLRVVPLAVYGAGLRGHQNTAQTANSSDVSHAESAQVCAPGSTAATAMTG